MSRKDFELLAAALKRALDRCEDNQTQKEGVAYAMNEIANTCQNQNPRFNRDRFLKACGL